MKKLLVLLSFLSGSACAGTYWNVTSSSGVANVPFVFQTTTGSSVPVTVQNTAGGGNGTALRVKGGALNTTPITEVLDYNDFPWLRVYGTGDIVIGTTRTAGIPLGSHGTDNHNYFENNKGCWYDAQDGSLWCAQIFETMVDDPAELRQRRTGPSLAAVTAGTTLGFIGWEGWTGAADGFQGMAGQIYSRVEQDCTPTNCPGNIVFATRDPSTTASPTDKVVITSGGRVGVGDNSPTEFFQVEGTGTTYSLKVTTNTAGSPIALAVTNSGTVIVGGLTAGRFVFSDTGTGGLLTDNTNWSVSGNTATFAGGNILSTSAALKTGVGTSSPLTKLHVSASDTANYTGIVENTSATGNPSGLLVVTNQNTGTTPKFAVATGLSSSYTVNLAVSNTGRTAVGHGAATELLDVRGTGTTYAFAVSTSSTGSPIPIDVTNAGDLQFNRMTTVRAYRSSAHTVTTTLSQLPFNAETKDNLNEFNTTTSSFTATAAGDYVISWNVSLSAAGDGSKIVTDVYQNNTVICERNVTTGATGDSDNGGTCQATLAVNDTIALHARNSAGSSGVNANAQSTFLHIMRVH